MTSLADVAQHLYNNGCAPLPIRPDGTKAPAVAWAAYRDTAPTADTIGNWFATIDTDGVGIVCGAASGNLEMLEVEARAAHLAPTIGALMADHGLADAWTTINNGWVELTPSGGMHWHYRVSDGPARPNTKLARRPATPAELNVNPAERVKVLIETRGQGGFTVVAPSCGRTHNSRAAWTLVAGGPNSIPTVTSEQRDALYAIIASCLDELPTPEPQPQKTTTGTAPTGTRPGDDYNTRATWDDILTPRGWTRGRPLGRDAYAWTRPGKHVRDGISATTGTRPGDTAADRLYVFTTSTEFEAEIPYSKFAAIALLEHGGDYTAAAKALAASGYGTQAPVSPGNAVDLHQLAGTNPQTTPRATLSVVDGSAVRVVETLNATRLTGLYGPTEDGVARALADLHHDNLRFCPQRAQWLHWSGSRWEWDLAGTHREMTRTLARELPEDSGWATFKRRALSAAGLRSVLTIAETDPRLTVHLAALDARPYELNTPGGIIDLRTGKLRPADPNALHTRTTTVAPDYTHPAPHFNRFLTDTFGGDADLTRYVQRLFGLSVIGTVLEQMLPFAHGTGANGKTTIAEAVMHTIGRGDGGYAITADSGMLMVRRHDEHPAELAQLAGTRMVVCSEIEDGQRFAEARIKQLTGRDSINARFMRQDPFTFTPTHTIWLLGNHKPTTTAGGPAFWRRLQLIPFRHVVPEGGRDPRLGEKLAEESGAILAWVAAGAADYLQAGTLGAPAAVRDATAAYALDQDTIGRFVDDACHLAAPLSCEVGTLRAAYEAWCADVGESPVSAKRLSQEIRERFGVEAVKGSKGRRSYVGIAPTSATQGDDGEGWFDR